jgi:hypothetical protein
MATALNAASTPWAYWDGYGPEGIYISYDNGVTLTYTFSMFDATNILSSAHLDPCFASDLGLGGACTTQPNGISYLSQSADVSVYPNPASSHLYIRSTAPAAVSIYNIVGEMIQQGEYNNETMDINTSSYASGIYIVQFKFADGTYTNRKFVRE